MSSGGNDGVIPRSDSALLEFAQNASSKITPAPTTFGLSTAFATRLSNATTGFQSAIAACSPFERNKTATIAKRTAKAILLSAVRDMVDLVRGDNALSDETRSELGIPPRALPSPPPVPDTPPGITVKSVSNWSVLLRLRDTGSTAKRGRPPRTAGVVLFAYIGASAPSNVKQYQFMGTSGRTLMELEFSDTLPQGTTVWITAAWFNGAKVNGPLATPVRVVLQGGGVLDVPLAA